MPDKDPVRIVGVDRIGDELVVAYSDDSSSVYTAQQLSEVTPKASASDGIEEMNKPPRGAKIEDAPE
jgi:hypothetical protein